MPEQSRSMANEDRTKGGTRDLKRTKISSSKREGQMREDRFAGKSKTKWGASKQHQKSSADKRNSGSMPNARKDCEYLYGTHPILAALTANKRKLHALYVKEGKDVGDSELFDRILRSAGMVRNRVVVAPLYFLAFVYAAY